MSSDNIRVHLPERERYFIRHRLRVLGLTSLKQYYLSAHWRRLQEKWRKTSCQRCGRTRGKMSLHHLTYERLGAELKSDLQTVCTPCHRALHGLPPVRRRRRRPKT